MMKKKSINTFIVLVFCLNIIFLVFLKGSNDVLDLILRLLAFPGLAWVMYLYYESLGSSNDRNQSEKILGNRKSELDKNPDSQFLNLINSSFLLLKDLNRNFDASIFFLQPDSDCFLIKNSMSNNFVERIPINSPVLKIIAHKKKSTIIYQKDDNQIWEGLLKDNSHRGSECIIIQPLFLNGHLTGMLAVHMKHFSDLNPNDQLLITHLAEIISLGVFDLDLLEKTINKIENQSRVFDLLTQIDIKHSESDILNKYRNIIHYFFNYDCLTISMLDENPNRANIKLIDGIKKYLPLDNHFYINGTINGLPYVKSSKINSSYEKFNLFRYSSSEKNNEVENNFLGISIMLDDNLWGAVMIERFNNKFFNKNDEKLLSLICRALQTNMLWHIEYQDMYENAIKDGLTGLLNHKTYIDRAREEIERGRRFQHRLVFLIFDLDKFKRINDTFGHPYGDYVIKTTSNIIKKNVRSIDLVARYGGEEFAVVLVNTNTDAALAVAKRIVKNIEEYNFTMNDNNVNMTISCGLSEYPSDSDKLKDLIQFADEGLYKTKDNGGNDVTIYSSIVS
jgi:diguanylate cyclase (GGDEF)-like protein